mmetsp:Transcript_16060/g.31386  ORF Transcript_16060/g.31386 Transcript_16060/m.31386 type:complete len:233 (-) Transcript_16060:210-908(-)
MATSPYDPRPFQKMVASWLCMTSSSVPYCRTNGLFGARSRVRVFLSLSRVSLPRQYTRLPMGTTDSLVSYPSTSVRSGGATPPGAGVLTLTLTLTCVKGVNFVRLGTSRSLISNEDPSTFIDVLQSLRSSSSSIQASSSCPRLDRLSMELKEFISSLFTRMCSSSSATRSLHLAAARSSTHRLAFCWKVSCIFSVVCSVLHFRVFWSYLNVRDFLKVSSRWATARRLSPPPT